MKIIAVAASLLISAASALGTLAAETVSDDRLEAPIEVASSGGNKTEISVNTRDRFGGDGVETKDEGAQSPIFSESNGE